MQKQSKVSLIMVLIEARDVVKCRMIRTSCTVKMRLTPDATFPVAANPTVSCAFVVFQRVELSIEPL